MHNSLSEPTITMPHYAIEQTKAIASYFRALYNAEVRGMNEDVPFPNWPIHLLEECQYAVKIIATAIQNQSKP
jgi:hypothetical protein